jgi:hypothetical protein
MLMFSAHDNVDLPAAWFQGSELPARSKQQEFRHIAKIEANTSAIRAAILASLVPNNVGFISEAPTFHDLKAFQQERVGTPEIEMTLR